LSEQTHVLPATQADLVVDLPSETGEGPLWNERDRCVYWVDIPPGRLYRYDPHAKLNELVYQHTAMIGGYTFQENGAILLFCSRGQIVRWHNGDIETIVEEIPGEADGRFNDVIAGPDGHVYCGTMPTATHLARLYRLNLDGSLDVLFDDIGLSNGFGFSPDNAVLYHTDSNARLIYRLAYESGTGALGNRTVLVRTAQDETVPDGMATDADGAIWSARWDGHALFKYSAEGELLGKVPFPVRKVSSITFGGDDLGSAYVTTAGGHLRGAHEGERAGSLFRVDLGVKGRPAFRSRIGL
jgi:D-xylonolactonase